MSAIRNFRYEDAIQGTYFSALQYSESEWEQVCDFLNKTVESLSKNYIWHRDEFKILPQFNQNIESDVPPHLTSITFFGDNIEDEWFIAYLVFQITKSHRDLIVQLEDNDGDFLLIEAADYLPSWANPETTKNRVFIYDNHLHLIPPELADLEKQLQLPDALKLITKYKEETKSSPNIEQAIFKRIGCYPQKINEMTHRATITIPIDLAALLILRPALISSLVHIYCNHDEIDARSCRRIRFENCVTISIKFTKFLYAMLLHSKLIRNGKLSLTDKKTVNGFKLACGYEMIINESKKDIFTSSQYTKFLSNLTKNGYFKDNIEGSNDYKELLEKANRYFMAMGCSVNSYVSSNISHLLSTDEFMKLKSSLKDNPNSYLLEEDNEDWMNVSPDAIDDFLKTNYRKHVKSNNKTSTSVTSDLNKFLFEKSDYEGIENTQNIEFDSDQFFKSVENMLDMVTLNNGDIEESSDSDLENLEEMDTELLDLELKKKLIGKHYETSEDNRSILSNLINSMKEEDLTGPSSNILRNLGVRKTDLLDSDNEYED